MPKTQTIRQLNTVVILPSFPFTALARQRAVEPGSRLNLRPLRYVKPAAPVIELPYFAGTGSASDSRLWAGASVVLMAAIATLMFWMV